MSGIILMTENMARTISPILGAALADRFHRFKLIGIFGYVFGKIIRKKSIRLVII